jgi:glycosyltransferase involved in cell wall biosynthesis
MRVAVATWSRRRVGGVEGYLGDLIPALVGAGHDVAFWCETDEPIDRDPIALSDGVPVICAAARGAANALAELVAWEPDVIYAHGFGDPAIGTQVLGVAPSVLFVHNYYGMCISGGKTFTRPVVTPCSRVFGWPCLLHYFPHGCGGRSPVTMARAYRQQAARLEQLRRCDAVVTHTDHMCRELARHGLTPRRVGYPIHGSGPRIDRPASPEKWRLLFAGRMDRLKGGHVLLEALSRVGAGLDRAVHVTFAGDGPERGRWERLASDVVRATVGVGIEFAGWVDPGRLDALMADADLLVVPSLWPEPFGAVGPIAGNQGLPAAAFDVGGIPQWLVDGVNGALAPGHPPTADGLADAIVRCLADPRVHARLRTGALEITDRFRMDAHLAAVLDVLREVTARRAAGRQAPSGR